MGTEVSRNEQHDKLEAMLMKIMESDNLSKELHRITDNHFGEIYSFPNEDSIDGKKNHRKDKSEKEEIQEKSREENPRFFIKIFIFNDSTSLETFRKKIEQLDSVSHSGLLKILKFKTFKRTMYCTNIFKLVLVSQYLQRDLSGEIRAKRLQSRSFSNEEIIKFIREAIDVLAHLQRNGLVLGNIRNTTILLSPIDNSYNFIYPLLSTVPSNMSHFQMTTFSQLDYSSLSTTGIYLSPEQMSQLRQHEIAKVLDFKSEVFTLGMIVLEMINLKAVDHFYDYQNFLVKRNSIDDFIEKTIQKKFNKEILWFLQNTLRFEADNRPDFISLEQEMMNQMRKSMDKENFPLQKSINIKHSNQIQNEIKRENLNQLNHSASKDQETLPEIMKHLHSQLSLSNPISLDAKQRNSHAACKEHKSISMDETHLESLKLCSDTSKPDILFPKSKQPQLKQMNNLNLNPSNSLKQSSQLSSNESNCHQSNPLNQLNSKKNEEYSQNQLESKKKFHNPSEVFQNPLNELQFNHPTSFTSGDPYPNNLNISQNNTVLPNHLESKRKQPNPSQNSLTESHYQHPTSFISADLYPSNSDLSQTPLVEAHPQQIASLSKKENHSNIPQTPLIELPLQQLIPYTSVETYEDGSVYSGQFLGPLRHGKGCFKYSDGGVYSGYWFQGQMHGYGILYYPSGEKAYDGEWSQDKFQGQGTIFHLDATIDQHKRVDFKDFGTVGEGWIKYQGDFVEDYKHGIGRLDFRDGSWFEGEFERDRIDGKGSYHMRNGEVFEGEWMGNRLIRMF